LKDVSYYLNREQTYLKHFFLEKYLERVAYVIGWSHPGFVYVDGFSGPWRSTDERFEDTSFIIAIQQLRKVRDGLAAAGKSPNIRCLFVEKDADSFASLKAATDSVTDLKIRVLHGDFEELINEVLQFVGSDFSLVFIDPTGWTGFALNKIAPVLKHTPGEVLINFMFDHVNRFFSSGVAPESFDELMGGPGWNDAFAADSRREDAIVDLYEKRLQGASSFKYVTHTRILKPTVDRAYFYLIYGTGHVKGLQEFRGVEEKCAGEQDIVRRTAKQQYRIKKTGQGELWSAESLPAEPASFEDEQRAQLDRATGLVRDLLRERNKVRFDEVLGRVLELPLVWEDDFQSILKQMRTEGEFTVEGMSTRERIVKPIHFLVAKNTRS
jgi:three-Cys-motif partner protein